MFLNRDFCMENLLAGKGSHYFPGKNKSFNVLLKIHKTNKKL